MVNYGIVGCGSIAQKHCKAIDQVKDARLAAVCDNNKDRLLRFEGKDGIKTYTHYDDLLKDPDVHAVIVCTPSGLHASIGEAAARSGKHILMEKPFVLNLEQGEKLSELCRTAGVVLGVVHPNRAKPVVKALREAITGGLFGKVTHASAVLRWNRSPEYYEGAAWRGTKEQDGGILYNQAIHNIDLFRWLLGPVDEVFAYGARQLRSIEYEDVCVSALKFQSGALGAVEAAVTLYPENLEESLAVFGSHGTAVLGGKTISRIKEWKFACMSEDEAASQAATLNSASDQAGHEDVVEDFTASIIEKREPMVSGEEAMKALYLINAIYQSVSSGQSVKIKSE